VVVLVSLPDRGVSSQINQTPPPEKKSKRPALYAAIAVTIAVIVVGAVMISSPIHTIHSNLLQPSIHLGYIPLKTLENITRTNLTEVKSSYNNTNSKALVLKGEEVLYNSSSGGHIMIIAEQFNGTQTAYNFYMHTVKTAFANVSKSYVIIANNTFNGFNFTTGVISFSGLYEGLSFGYRNSFYFLVYDWQIPANLNEVAQQQILTMT
jgi:hypothetical protein